MVHKPHVGFLKTLDKLDLAALACLSPNFLLIAMADIFGFLENRVFNLHSSLKSLKGHRGHKLPGPPEERPRLFFSSFSTSLTWLTSFTSFRRSHGSLFYGTKIKTDWTKRAKVQTRVSKGQHEKRVEPDSSLRRLASEPSYLKVPRYRLSSH